MGQQSAISSYGNASSRTQGLDNLQSGLLGIIKGTQSVGEAFTSMADTIVDGLLKIALEQAIIKPLGSLLFGGGDGGGSGIFGSVLKGITGAITGKRANGGLTRSGDYLVGERGPEVVSIGNTANVATNRELQRDDRPAGNVINFGPITSNDPAMVRALVVQGIAQAMPTISNQAMNTTLTKARRPSL